MNIKIETLFHQATGLNAEELNALPLSGSIRKYFRVFSNNDTVIACYNANYKENLSFIRFTEHFLSKGLAVPKILGNFPDENIYFLEDLGDTTLFNLIEIEKEAGTFSQNLINLYKSVIDHLLLFQIKGREGFDFSIAYPRAKFDKQSMLWDLNYFKHYFIKLAGVPFDEQELEDDFSVFSDYLLQAGNTFFLYRDFQSRNIMIKEGKLYFIDYQGGRQGALQYDLASLLWDAKAGIPQDLRNLLLEHYLDRLSHYISFDREEFKNLYYPFVLIRIMQACGAYGYRGFFERKQHFLLSIPNALSNLKWITENIHLKIKIPALMRIFELLINSPGLQEFHYQPKTGLTVQLRSFSYKRSVPLDNSGNGGGFVFDCRFLPNPGREEAFRELTGNDPAVIEYLDSKDEVRIFMDHVKCIIDQAVKNYLERKFTNLMISFGCTGGRHRSVYCANHLHAYLQKYKDMNLEIRHIEQEIVQKEAKA